MGWPDEVGDDDKETIALEWAEVEREDTTEAVRFGADDDDWTPVIKMAPSMSKAEEVGLLIADFK